MPTSEVFSHISTVLLVTGGVEIDDSSDGTGDSGLSLLLYWRSGGGTTDIVARILNGLG